MSDAALVKLLPAAEPSAWIILEHPELVPATEMQALKSVAPVLTSVAQVQSFAAAPLAFTNGLTGTAFYDQNARLILTVTNPTDSNVTGFAMLHGIPSGTYNILDLFGNTMTQFTAVSGGGAVPLTVTRWDTRAFAITSVGSH